MSTDIETWNAIERRVATIRQQRDEARADRDALVTRVEMYSRFAGTLMAAIGRAYGSDFSASIILGAAQDANAVELLEEGGRDDE